MLTLPPEADRHSRIHFRPAYPDLIFGADEENQETTELVTSLNPWKNDRRFVVLRVLKNEKNRAQMSFLDGEEYAYSFFVTNTDLSPEEAVDFY